MKPIKIISKQEPINEEIDWSKPQWMYNKKHNILVLSTGVHGGGCFIGAALPCEKYKDGEFSAMWDKSDFKPLKHTLTIEISN